VLGVANLRHAWSWSTGTRYNAGLVGRTPHGSPAPGSSHGSCAPLTWQEELDMSGGPSGDMMETKMGLERGTDGNSAEDAPILCHMTNKVV